MQCTCCTRLEEPYEGRDDRLGPRGDEGLDLDNGSIRGTVSARLLTRDHAPGEMYRKTS